MIRDANRIQTQDCASTTSYPRWRLYELTTMLVRQSRVAAGDNDDDNDTRTRNVTAVTLPPSEPEYPVARVCPESCARRKDETSSCLIFVLELGHNGKLSFALCTGVLGLPHQVFASFIPRIPIPTTAGLARCADRNMFIFGSRSRRVYIACGL